MYQTVGRTRLWSAYLHKKMMKLFEMFWSCWHFLSFWNFFIFLIYQFWICWILDLFQFFLLFFFFNFFFRSAGSRPRILKKHTWLMSFLEALRVDFEVKYTCRGKSGKSYECQWCANKLSGNKHCGLFFSNAIVSLFYKHSL